VTKIVRQEKIVVFKTFYDAIKNTNGEEVIIDVEDFNFPDSVEIEGKTYRKKWLNNKRVYIYVD
jgi:hypothetical protein